MRKSPDLHHNAPSEKHPSSSSSLPSLSFSQHSFSSTDPDALKRSLKQFAEQGSWKLVYKLTESYKPPQVATEFSFEVKLCRVISLLKLRLYKNASEELLSVDFSSPIVPFSLRIVNAVCPAFSGNQQLALDNLYNLCAWLELQKMDEKDMKRRLRRTHFALVTVLCAQRDFVAAIEVVKGMIANEAENGKLYSILGQLYLELGDLKRAKESFSVCVGKCSELESKMNEGLLCFAMSEYEKASECFASVLTDKENPEYAKYEVVARNNRACCLLYTKDLKNAIASLHGPLFEKPKVYLEEVVVFNLSILVDLCENPTERKNEINKLIVANGEDFSNN